MHFITNIRQYSDFEKKAPEKKSFLMSLILSDILAQFYCGVQ